MRVFIDQPNCADGNPDDMCSLEGYKFPCCHVHKGTDVKGYITMMSQEDSVDNGLITCKVAVGADTSHMDSCLEPEFCNGLNTTCPMNGPQPVQFNFGWSTDDWGRTHVSCLRIRDNLLPKVNCLTICCIIFFTFTIFSRLGPDLRRCCYNSPKAKTC